MSTTLTEEQQRLLDKVLHITEGGETVEIDGRDSRFTIWSAGSYRDADGNSFDSFSVKEIVCLCLALAAAPVLTAEQEAAIDAAYDLLRHWENPTEGATVEMNDWRCELAQKLMKFQDAVKARKAAAPSPVSTPAEQEPALDEFKPTHRSCLLGDYIQLLNDRTRPCAAYRSLFGCGYEVTWSQFDATYEPLKAKPAPATTEPVAPAPDGVEGETPEDSRRPYTECVNDPNLYAVSSDVQRMILFRERQFPHKLVAAYELSELAQTAPAAAETEPDDDRREEFVRLFESYDNGEIAASFDPKGGYLTFHRGDSIKDDFHLGEIVSLIEAAPRQQEPVDPAQAAYDAARLEGFDEICKLVEPHLHEEWIGKGIPIARYGGLVIAIQKAIYLRSKLKPSIAEIANKALKTEDWADAGFRRIVALVGNSDLVERDGRLVPAQEVGNGGKRNREQISYSLEYAMG